MAAKEFDIFSKPTHYLTFSANSILILFHLAKLLLLLNVSNDDSHFVAQMNTRGVVTKMFNKSSSGRLDRLKINAEVLLKFRKHTTLDSIFGRYARREVERGWISGQFDSLHIDSLSFCSINCIKPNAHSVFQCSAGGVSWQLLSVTLHRVSLSFLITQYFTTLNQCRFTYIPTTVSFIHLFLLKLIYYIFHIALPWKFNIVVIRLLSMIFYSNILKHVLIKAFFRHKKSRLWEYESFVACLRTVLWLPNDHFEGPSNDFSKNVTWLCFRDDNLSWSKIFWKGLHFSKLQSHTLIRTV